MYYLGNISLFVVVLILACTYKTKSTPVTNDVSYENCSPNDELFGEKLSSVVNYVNKMVGIDTRYGEDAASQYVRFCEAYATHLNNPMFNNDARRFIGKSPYSYGDDLGGLIERDHYFSDQFFVLKVFRNGDSMYVQPTYSWSTKTVTHYFFGLGRKTSNGDSGWMMRRFYFNSDYLRQIVDKIKQEAVNNWD